MKRDTTLKTLFALASMYASLIASEAADWQMNWQNTKLATISFINKTGHDVSLKIKQKGIDRAPVVISKDRDTVEKAITLQNQNLDRVDSYDLTYTHGVRQYYSAAGYVTTLTIDPKTLALMLEQRNQSNVNIIIKPTTLLGYVTGFDKPEYKILSSDAKKASDFALDESFIVMGTNPETQFLLSQFDLDMNSQPYELFGLPPYPIADSSKSYNEQSQEVFEYAKKLEQKRSALLKKYADDISLDVSVEKKYRIKNFTQKMRSLIESAYQEIVLRMGL